MGMLPIRKYTEEGSDNFGPLEKPFEFDNIPPKDIKLIFECEECNDKISDDVSNVAYNGAPMCCNEEMMLSHGKVKII